MSDQADEKVQATRKIRIVLKVKAKQDTSSAAKQVTTIAASQTATSAIEAVTAPDGTEKWQCPNCGMLLSVRDSVIRHQKTAHSVARPFPCPYDDCPYSVVGYKRKDALVFHLRTAHPEVDPEDDYYEDSD